MRRTLFRWVVFSSIALAIVAAAPAAAQVSGGTGATGPSPPPPPPTVTPGTGGGRGAGTEGTPVGASGASGATGVVGIPGSAGPFPGHGSGPGGEAPTGSTGLLPFTGFGLLVLAAVAAGLIASGLEARRRSTPAD